MPANRPNNRHRTSLNKNEAEVLPGEVARIYPTKRKDRAHQNKPIKLGEVIEISSDDDGDELAPSLHQQVMKLKEENSGLKHDLVQAQGELLLLRSLPRLGHNQFILDLSQFDDNICCDICSSRMWSPHLLPECGHAFCQSCLNDWFSSTLAQFVAAHPHFNVNDPVPQTQGVMQNPHVFRHLPMAAHLQHSQPPQPQYTCPTCREPVKNRPVEDFSLKALIRSLATAAGESSPKKTTSGRSTRGKVSPPSGPWDGFFPRIA